MRAFRKPQRGRHIGEAAGEDKFDRNRGRGKARRRCAEAEKRRLSGEQVRVLIDASLVEVFPEGRTAGTHRAYPTGEQSYRLVTEPGVHAQAWTLRLP